MRASAYVCVCLLALSAWGQVVGGVIGVGQSGPPPPPPPVMAQRGAPQPPGPLPVGIYRISGTVVDGPAGTPLAKATVMLTRNDPNRQLSNTVTTGADGRFSFNKIAAGKYNLSARRKGYPLQGLNDHEGFSTGVVIGPDIPADPITFRLRPDGILTGRVTDDANEPVTNAQVMLFRKDVAANGTDTPRQMSTTSTNYNGEYRFAHLRPGSYMIAVMGRPWYAQPAFARQVRRSDGTFETQEPPPSPLDVTFPLTFYPGATEESGAAPIELQAGDRASVDLSLHPVQAVRVRVRMPAPDQPTPQPGQPPPPPRMSFSANLRQKVFGSEVFVNTNTTMPSPNAIDLVGVAPGHYAMDVRGFDQKNPMEARQEIDAGLDSEVDASRSVVFPVSVSGTLQLEGPAPAPATVDRQSRPMPLRVQLFQAAGGGQGGVATVSADGTFEFQQKLGPGKYQLRVMGSTSPAYVKSVTAAGARYSAGFLEIGANAVKLTVTAGQGYGTVDGLAERDGKGVPDTMVVLVPDDPVAGKDFFRRDQSDSDGTFTLRNVVPGRYTLIVLNTWDIAWQDPEILRKYLAHGQLVEVASGGKYKVKTEVQ